MRIWLVFVHYLCTTTFVEPLNCPMEPLRFDSMQFQEPLIYTHSTYLFIALLLLDDRCHALLKYRLTKSLVLLCRSTLTGTPAISRPNQWGCANTKIIRFSEYLTVHCLGSFSEYFRKTCVQEHWHCFGIIA